MYVMCAPPELGAFWAAGADDVVACAFDAVGLDAAAVAAACVAELVVAAVVAVAVVEPPQAVSPITGSATAIVAM
jgi:hypothetical protein